MARLRGIAICPFLYNLEDAVEADGDILLDSGLAGFRVVKAIVIRRRRVTKRIRFYVNEYGMPQIAALANVQPDGVTANSSLFLVEKALPLVFQQLAMPDPWVADVVKADEGKAELAKAGLVGRTQLASARADVAEESNRDVEYLRAEMFAAQERLRVAQGRRAHSSPAPRTPEMLPPPTHRARFNPTDASAGVMTPASCVRLPIPASPQPRPPSAMPPGAPVLSLFGALQRPSLLPAELRCFQVPHAAP